MNNSGVPEGDNGNKGNNGKNDAVDARKPSGDNGNNGANATAEGSPDPTPADATDAGSGDRPDPEDGRSRFTV
jgi:hypothetical protein